MSNLDQTSGIEGTDAETQVKVTFEDLVRRVKHLPYRFPSGTESVAMDRFGDRAEEIATMAGGVTPIVDASVWRLLEVFLCFKSKEGTRTERQLYTEMCGDPSALFTRLLRNRPISFWGKDDRYVLPTLVDECGNLQDQNWGGYNGPAFEAIGCDDEKHPLLLQDYLSYDEMAISALVSVWVPTPFINNGDRNSNCVTGVDGSFQTSGMMFGSVGARLVKEGFMEAKHMLISATQNTAEHGYGPSREGLLSLWADWYGVPYFPTFDEVHAIMQTPRSPTRFHCIKKECYWCREMVGEAWTYQMRSYCRQCMEYYGTISNSSDLPRYLDKTVYAVRMRRVIEPFLLKASEAGVSHGAAGAHVRVKGLGLGVWQLDPIQEEIMMDVYADVLRSRNLAGISVLEFAWFPSAKLVAGVGDKQSFPGSGNHSVEIRFTECGFAAPVGERLLIAMYAWDGNSYPGNEWWSGRLGSTDDSAAASCSLISSLQHPVINAERLCATAAQVLSADGVIRNLRDHFSRI